MLGSRLARAVPGVPTPGCVLRGGAAAVAGATGMADPYERLKKLTRGKKVTPEAMREFISGLGMPDDVEARLLALTPATYTGLAAELVSHLDD